MANEDIIKQFQMAANVQEIGFAEFTTDLITDTADAIVASTIKQIRSFSELVKELATGLTAFQEKNAGPQAVRQYLIVNFPNADGSDTAIRVEAEYGRALYGAIVEKLGPIEGLVEPEGDTPEMFSEENVAAIEMAARNILMERSEKAFEQLENLVRVGYARVVFDDGHILTRLKFNVHAEASEAEQTSRSRTSRTDLNASLSAGLVGFVGKGFGWANLGFSGRHSRINVESVRTQQFEAVTMNANILGEVRVDFRTETFDIERLRIEANRQTPA